MSNDSVINRLSNSEPTSTSVHRKLKSDQVDVHQLSFFEELLSIGNFESRQLEPLDPNAGPPKAETSTNDVLPDSETDKGAKEGDSKGTDESQVDSNVTSIAYGVLLPNQPANPIPVAGIQEKPSSNSEKPTVEPTLPDDTTTVNTATAKSQQPPTVAESGTELPASSSPDQLVESNLLPVNGAVKHDEKADLNASKEPFDKNRLSKRGSDEPSKTSHDSLLTAKEKVAREVRKGLKTEKPTNSRKQTVPVTSQEPATQISEVPHSGRRAEHLANKASGNDNSGNGRNSLLDQERAVDASRSTEDNTIQFESTLSMTNASATSAGFNAVVPALGMQPVNSITAPTAAFGPPAIERSVVNQDPTVIGITATSSSGRETAPGHSISPNTTFTNPSSSNPSVSGKPEVARTASGSSISPYQEVKLVQRVLRGLEQLGDGGGQVKLRLHPPELGTLQLTLRMESGQMFARMEVETPAARDALLNNVQTLKDRLADQGMEIQSFEVQVTTDSTSSGSNGSNMQQNGGFNSDSRWEQATSRFAQMNNNRLSSEATPAERSPQQAWTRTNGSIDLTV